MEIDCVFGLCRAKGDVQTKMTFNRLSVSENAIEDVEFKRKSPWLLGDNSTRFIRLKASIDWMSFLVHQVAW